MDAAKSQYLGGDAQHTHLVKGLDKSLLKQERLRLQSETVAANPQRTAPSLDAPAALAGSGPDTFEAFHAAAAGRAAAAMRGGGAGQRTHTALGGEVLALLESVEYNAGEAAKYALPGATPPSQGAGGGLASALSAALGLKTASGHAKWHPGRTTLQYSLTWAGDAGMPTMLLRSADDCPPPPQGVTDASEPGIKECIVAALMAPAKAAGGGGRGVPPPPATRPAPAPAPPAGEEWGSSDDELFPDAAEYTDIDDVGGQEGGGAAHDAEGGGGGEGGGEAAEAAFKAAFAPVVVEEGEEEEEAGTVDAKGRLRGLGANTAALGDAGYGYGERFTGGIGDVGEEEEEEGGGPRKRGREVSEEESARREARRQAQRAASRFEKEFNTVQGLMAKRAAKRPRKDS